MSEAATFPRPLAEYPDMAGEPLSRVLAHRVELEPFNAIATGIFALAILHTFAAPRFTALAHRIQHRHDERAKAAGRPPMPALVAEVLHFFGEVEVVFGLWAVVLATAMTVYAGFDATKLYLNDTVDYKEALFVVVIMAMAATRPIVTFAEAMLERVARLAGGTPAAWWITILTIGPVLGSLITEPAAMTISALLLARRFFELQPSVRLKYGTLGLLFVNVSIGGTLTHFAAPPVLMVAERWQWDTMFMLTHFGWRAVTAIVLSTGAYYLLFRRELNQLPSHSRPATVGRPDASSPSRGLLPVPMWLVLTHMLFMGWTVFTAHYPALFVSGFLFFLGMTRATGAYRIGNVL